MEGLTERGVGGLRVAAAGALAFLLIVASTEAHAQVVEAHEVEAAEEAPATAEPEARSGFTFARSGFTFDGHVTAWLRAELKAPDAIDASVPLLRPWFSLGFPGDRLRFRFKADFDNDVQLLDAYLELEVTPKLDIAAGRFKTPFSRLWMTPTRELELPDRGVAVDEFALGRAAGIMLSGKPARAFGYYVGAVAEEHIPIAIARLELALYGSVPANQTPSLDQVHPSGLSIGFDGYFTAGSLAGDEAGTNPEQEITGGADIELVEGPFTLLAEGFVRGPLEKDAVGGIRYGAVGEASVFVLPRRLELVGRGSWVDPDRRAEEDLQQVYEAGLTAYLAKAPPLDGHHLKLSVRYRFDTSDRTHRVTAQFQLFL